MPYNKYNIYDIIVDDSFEIYAKLRFKKIIKFIPALLAYQKNDSIYNPSYSVEGTNEFEINEFFKKCQSKKE